MFELQEWQFLLDATNEKVKKDGLSAATLGLRVAEKIHAGAQALNEPTDTEEKHETVSEK